MKKETRRVLIIIAWIVLIVAVIVGIFSVIINEDGSWTNDMEKEATAGELKRLQVYTFVMIFVVFSLWFLGRNSGRKSFGGKAIFELPDKREFKVIAQRREGEKFFLELRDLEESLPRYYVISEKKFLDEKGDKLEEFPSQFGTRIGKKVKIRKSKSFQEEAEYKKVYYIFPRSSS